MWRDPISAPTPWLLGQGGLEQLQDSPYQVQASCNQHMDGSGLPENAGPTAGRGVAEEAPWRAWGLKDGIPALADPLQGMGDAAKNKGVCASRVRRASCQQHRAWSPGLGAGAAPEVRVGLFLAQATPMLLVLEAAEQHLVQSHREVLLVCRVQDKACQWRGGGKGLAHSGPLLAPGPS